MTDTPTGPSPKPERCRGLFRPKATVCSLCSGDKSSHQVAHRREQRSQMTCHCGKPKHLNQRECSSCSSERFAAREAERLYGGWL